MYVIETMMLDGPHWYRGIIKEDNGKATLIGPGWSPYFEDARVFSVIDNAEMELRNKCKEMPGAEVKPVTSSLMAESRWHNNGHYYMMLKYCEKGMQVGIANVAGPFTVTLVNRKYIILKQGDRVERVAKKTPIFVEILGKVAVKIITDETSD